RMYAAADFLLMPSLFEPCGLNQMIAMHYGGLPVVRHVGGLADTVDQDKNFDPMTNRGYGIVFSRATERSFFKAFGRAVELYDDKSRYNGIAKHNMHCDFSWQQSAKAYKALYRMISR
ncbi:MAG: glycogen synthase, partial [Thiovulaceae bacterium]|nr:glycogen synthase [Sulfurimonadaceae bacterium]